MRKLFTLLILLAVIPMSIFADENAMFTANSPASSPTSFALYTKPSTGWNGRLIVDNSTSKTPVTVNSTNCFGKREVTISAYKSGILESFGGSICGPDIGVLNVGASAARITSEARFLSGMLLNFESATDSLNAYGDKLTVGGIEINDNSSTFVLIVNDGATGGIVTLDLDGTRERVPISGKNVSDPNSGWVFKKLSTKTTSGVLTAFSGCMNSPGLGQGGCDPSTAPGGPVFVWSVVGPENGLSAPRVRVLRSPST